jgi:uncharacterized protein (TIGR02145 family)
MKNYYYILGINYDATEIDIKKAYRKLSLKFHPDKNDGDKFFEERFKEINEAYENLIDTNKRKLHDSILHGSNFKSSQKVTSNQPKKEEHQHKQEKQDEEKKRPTKRQWPSKQFFKKLSYITFILIIILKIFIINRYILQSNSQSVSSITEVSSADVKNSSCVDYDGNVYNTIKFGELTWTKTNFDVTHFRNGDIIMQAKNKDEWDAARQSKTPAWRYLNYNPKNDTIGKIYNGYAIIDYRGLAPDGYRVPTSADWGNLIGYMSGSFRESIKKKPTYEWKDFSALFAGFPTCISNCAIFWSSTKSNFQECLISITMYSSDNSHPFHVDKYMVTPIEEGLSVRCVKDD